MGDVARRVLAQDLRRTAPAHAPIEALRTVRWYETAGLLTTAQAQSVTKEDLAAEVDHVGPERWLLASVWRARHNLCAYDTPYVTIAQHRGIPLVTLDRRLARRVGRRRAGDRSRRRSRITARSAEPPDMNVRTISGRSRLTFG